MKNKLIMQHTLRTNDDAALIFTTEELTGLNNKILYWDGIINLQFKFGMTIDTPEIDLLKKERLFEDVFPLINENATGSIPNIFREATKNKILELLDNKEINYVTDGIHPNIMSESGMADPIGGSILHLTNSFPVIDDSIPIHEVLNFREKNKDLHRHLINLINALELRVLSAELPGNELKKAIHELDTGCAEAIYTYQKSNLKFNLSNIKVNFNMEKIIKISSAIYGGAQLILPTTCAAIAGILAGAVSTINWEDSIKIKNINRDNPFNYITELKKANFIK
ncbi:MULTISPECIES: DUF6236 family protein [Klebsiella pneumoniae complex]|uniref:DUF6236 family protein n=1 Tax=Klebsiella pneumoniae complex TaxID=3390273 RepID=UPI000C7D7B9D|nr:MULTISPECIES: DUF6236 family protein [Klebsiella]HBQ2311533.1 hypothetical protein [Klebsiella variicola]HCI6017902.1 hypothetical protein [Klebsiella quasipneumoniae subsp. similipneumoniae]MBC4316597.1 hypothetical protein [Klebsiella quasipneumoniae]PLJ57187.1 hypothetical protein B6J70_18790 [Klebsiella pneumoniae]UTA41898.1 hypothetical protein J6597_16460 [Klebsiella quasipneumoniae]